MLKCGVLTVLLASSYFGVVKGAGLTKDVGYKNAKVFIEDFLVGSMTLVAVDCSAWGQSGVSRIDGIFLYLLDRRRYCFTRVPISTPLSELGRAITDLPLKYLKWKRSQGRFFAAVVENPSLFVSEMRGKTYIVGSIEEIDEKIESGRRRTKVFK